MSSMTQPSVDLPDQAALPLTHVLGPHMCIAYLPDEGWSHTTHKLAGPAAQQQVDCG